MTSEDLNWAAVLAGGRSSRFGSNKALAFWGGESLVGRIIRQLRVSFDHVMIISDDTESYAFTGCPVYSDTLPGKGPVAGLCSALEHCRGEYLFLTACDMPFISERLIDELRSRIRMEDADIAAVHCCGKLQPFQAFYSRKLLERIEPAQSRGLHSLLDSGRTVVIEGYEESFVNINSLEDLEKLRTSE